MSEWISVEEKPKTTGWYNVKMEHGEGEAPFVRTLAGNMMET